MEPLESQALDWDLGQLDQQGGSDPLSQNQGDDWQQQQSSVGSDADLSRLLEKVRQEVLWQESLNLGGTDGQDQQWADGGLLGSIGEINGDSEASGGTTTKVLLALQTSVEGWESVVSSLPPHTDVVLLNDQQSGIQEISRVLREKTAVGGYKSVFLVVPSSGTGTLQIGSDELSLEGREQWIQGVSQWKDLLGEANTIKIWLHDQAAGADGEREALIEEIRNATEVQVELLYGRELEGTIPAAASLIKSVGVQIGETAPDLDQEARRILEEASISGRLEQALESAYGAAALEIKATVEAFIRGEIRPEVRWAEFNSAWVKGAYIAEEDLILIDNALEEQGEMRLQVLLEEVGHWLEDQAGLADSPGDEGERLALALITGQALYEGQGEDNDSAQLLIGAEERLVNAELAAPANLSTASLGQKTKSEDIILTFKEKVNPGYTSPVFSITYMSSTNYGAYSGVVKSGLSVTNTNYLVFNGDNTITFKPYNIPWGTHIYGTSNIYYAIQWQAGSLRDAGSNLSTKFYSPSWQVVADTTPPQVDTTYIGAKDYMSDVTLSFNERVKQGSGTFELYALPQSNSTTGATKVGEGFSVTDTNYLVFNNNNTVTLKVNNLTLLGGHRYGKDANHYAVKWGSSNVQDLQANNLATDAYSAIWTRIGDITPPQADTTYIGTTS
ncbi:MAG: DUF4347 domain-containing protein, partial [Vulcanococcus sp.]